MTLYDLARGLHILAVIAWMAGLLFLPRLFAYDAEQSGKPDPLRSEMQGLLRAWQTRLLRIIINPAMILAFFIGLWLLHIRGWETAREPWMMAKLSGVAALGAWHGFLAGERKKIASGSSSRTGRFWRMTNEIPFVIAIIMVVSVTTEWRFN